MGWVSGHYRQGADGTVRWVSGYDRRSHGPGSTAAVSNRVRADVATVADAAPFVEDVGVTLVDSATGRIVAKAPSQAAVLEHPEITSQVAGRVSGDLLTVDGDLDDAEAEERARRYQRSAAVFAAMP